jgi:hypothetical protein
MHYLKASECTESEVQKAGPLTAVALYRISMISLQKDNEPSRNCEMSV